MRSFLGVVLDIALRQRLLELVDLGLGEVGIVVEVKLLQLRELGQRTQVGELVVAEVKQVAAVQ